jgi:TonB family protein
MGAAVNARILHSSGSGLLDRETLTMVQRASPLPPTPPELPGAQISIVVPIRYRRGRSRRVHRDRGQDQEDQALEGGARESDARAQEAPADIADVGGRHRRAQLPRLAAIDPVE